MLGAILGRARAGEQTLLKRLVRRPPGPRTAASSASTVIFPGYDLITAILHAGGHVIARVKRASASRSTARTAAGCPTVPA